jgi:NTE family protein
LPHPESTVLHLALQGGGAHGAFTWGVLDRLLDEPGVEIGRISGTSAGALNGAALATGYARDGREGAKRQLALLWQKVAQAGLPLTLLLMPLRKPGMGVWDDAMPLLSPYQTNPLGMSPLRRVLDAVVDAEVLRDTTGPQLFVNAVNVRTGHARVFRPSEMSIDAILASACAPLMFQAVQIDGESYWDGSYAGNPMLWPLYENSLDADILMVELTPLLRPEVPTTAKNILNRINEIASINGLISELRAMDLMNRNGGHGGALRFHVLSLPDEASKLEIEPSIKRTVAGELFESLRQSGHAACERWLAQHRDKIGVSASIDIQEKYLVPYGQGRTVS